MRFSPQLKFFISVYFRKNLNEFLPNLIHDSQLLSAGTPSRPNIFKVTNKTSESVTLTWRVKFNKEEQFHTYSLQLSVNKGNWTVIQNITTQSGGGLITYTYDDLRDHIEYDFRLSICNIFGCNMDPKQIITVNTYGRNSFICIIKSFMWILHAATTYVLKSICFLVRLVSSMIV
jgi:hypothetical protein